MREKHFILATAGHVDHGKSALVRALTGTDSDRLPEEKERGITIELGFAHLRLNSPNESGENYSIGLIDVPGHEDFVSNMVS
ncbi:MAG TPA: GTP-binding protein, partial [Chthoniobacterales bacterium]